MKVVFAIPALYGDVKMACVLSLTETLWLLFQKGIPWDIVTVTDCPYLPTARNTMAAMFLADPDATDLFSIDADVGFDALAVLAMLERPEDLVGGVYPVKRDDEVSWPVQIKTQDGVPVGRDGLIEAEYLPGGFMRVKRHVFEKLRAAYPKMHYRETVIRVQNRPIADAHDYYAMGVDGARDRYTTEDYAFCARWRAIGGQCWVYPNIDFQHVGRKAYVGNYHEYLLRLPGGALGPPAPDTSRAETLDGWLSPDEARWLAVQAQNAHIVVEVGSAYGRSTRAMADNLGPHGVIYALDDWLGPRDVLDAATVAKIARADATAKEEFRQAFGFLTAFRHNLGDHIAAHRVIPVVCDHGGVDVQQFPRPDMVFLDGDHREASVQRDIALWRERLVPGGLLCGHDGDRPEVAAALRDLTPCPTPGPGSLWYWRKSR